MDFSTNIPNGSLAFPVDSIRMLDYAEFYSQLLRIPYQPELHCIQYFAHTEADHIILYCLIADDSKHTTGIIGHRLPTGKLQIPSATPSVPALHLFERAISEKTGIQFTGHPWMKPVRFPQKAGSEKLAMNQYPFYKIQGENLHEVGVGPVHAGIIEPGHFRFICHGEQVLHLEIHLGYQHRGIESLFLKKNHPLQQSILAESIAGDTAIGHTLAYACLAESMTGFEAPPRLQKERILALEMERIAVHLADTSALCTDVAYQFGQVVCEALRTIVINSTQSWCGNRFGKGLIRPSGTNYPLTTEIAEELLKNLIEVKKRYTKISNRIFTLASVLDRFEQIGTLSYEQMLQIGAVGMAARMAGLTRDIRSSHPFQHFRLIKFDPVILSSGDVKARAYLRKLEAEASLDLCIQWLNEIIAEGSVELPVPNYNIRWPKNKISYSLIEGWRGEICHVALTNENGELANYQIKDPSFHNWIALALALRGQEISDFPVNNKSFNLSYAGFDL